MLQSAVPTISATPEEWQNIYRWKRDDVCLSPVETQHLNNNAVPTNGKLVVWVGGLGFESGGP